METHRFLLAIFMLFVCTVSSSVILYDEQIKMDMLMDFEISFNNTVKKYSLDDKPAVVDGSAAAGAKKQFVEVKVTEASEDTIRFSFDYDSKDHLILTALYSFYLDHDATARNATFVRDLNVIKGTDKSFFCELPITYMFKLDNDDDTASLSVTAVMSRARIQAFGLVSTGFSWGVECGEDFSTHTQGNYSIETCVKLTSIIDVDIDYMMNGPDHKTSANVRRVFFPVGEVKNDTCSTTVNQSMTLSFYDRQFVLSFEFQKTDEKNYEVHLANIHLQYTVDEVLFPNATHNGTFLLRLESPDKSLYSFRKGEYFKCKSNMTYKMTDGAKAAHTASLHTSNFKYIAFNKGTDPPALDGKSFEQCPEDVTVSNIVPIAVGAALGILVVIVLIAYLIGRRKSHKGYESV